MIFIGIDDTDSADSPGTNRLARRIRDRLSARVRPVVVVRHQLLVDPRIPYTSKNSSASLLFEGPESAIESVVDESAQLLRSWCAPGSDPGLCVASLVPPIVTSFGRHAQQEVITRREAEEVAAEADMRLIGLGGTHGGVIGALAAVGLAAAGDDGRVVAIRDHPDDLHGVHTVAQLLVAGVDEIREMDSGRPVGDGLIDVGKRLRPNRRDGRIVLFVGPAGAVEAGIAGEPDWRAVRLP